MDDENKKDDHPAARGASLSAPICSEDWLPTAAAISRYLVYGMHHGTKEGQASIAKIIHEHFQKMDSQNR